MSFGESEWGIERVSVGVSECVGERVSVWGESECVG